MDAAIDLLRRFDAGHPFFEKLLVTSGRMALAANDRVRARRDLGEAVDRIRRHRGPGDPAFREAEALLRRAAP
jgi:hypothetical protein